MNALQIEKAKLRRQFQKKLGGISNREAKSQHIANKILKLPKFQKGTSIMLFSPTDTEVDISHISEICLEVGKMVYLPSCERIIASPITKATKLFLNSYNFLEPVKPAKTNPQTISIAIIPGLAFSENCTRLGHGGGWYDQFLQSVNVDCKIGVCFSEQLTTWLPQEEHDVQIDLVITD